MKALLTANYQQEYLGQLLHYMDIHPTGFATGGGLLNEGDLIQKLTGTEVIICYLKGDRPKAVANPAVFESANFPGRGGLLFGAVN